MNILFIQESDWFIRGPHNQQHLAERLSLKGHKIRVIDHDILWKTRPRKALYAKRQIFSDTNRIFPEAKITVIRPGFIRIILIDYISLLFTHCLEIKRQIRDFAPDVIVGFGILDSYLAANITRRSITPFVYYWIDLLHTLIPFKLLQPLGRLIESATIGKSDMLIATNSRLRNRIIGMKANPERSFILGFGIDKDKFHPALDGKEVRQNYGIKGNEIALFFIGILNPLTGVKDVVIELSKFENEHVKFLCAGSGISGIELSRLKEELGLKDRLILTGAVPYPDVPRLIAASDVCLLPFHNVEMMRDIVPLKLFDYMAMGKPIVSTRLPGIVEEFGDDNGIVFVDHPSQVVKKAIELFNNGQAAAIGIKGRKFVENITWDKITDKFEVLLQQAIDAKGRTKNKVFSKEALN